MNYNYYCKATIFSELLNLAKAMTHETLNLLALNVRSKVTLYSHKSIKSQDAVDAVVLFIKTLN